MFLSYNANLTDFAWSANRSSPFHRRLCYIVTYYTSPRRRRSCSQLHPSHGTAFIPLMERRTPVRRTSKALTTWNINVYYTIETLTLITRTIYYTSITRTINANLPNKHQFVSLPISYEQKKRRQKTHPEGGKHLLPSRWYHAHDVPYAGLNIYKWLYV